MDNLPLLNLNNGWGSYFLTLAAIACTLLFLVHLPFIVSDAARKRKTDNRTKRTENISVG